MKLELTTRSLPSETTFIDSLFILCHQLGISIGICNSIKSDNFIIFIVCYNYHYYCCYHQLGKVVLPSISLFKSTETIITRTAKAARNDYLKSFGKKDSANTSNNILGINDKYSENMSSFSPFEATVDEIIGNTNTNCTTTYTNSNAILILIIN